MDLVLDGQGPLQAQLARALRHAIATGRLADGARIPSTRELADALGLSRGTVVVAYQQLQAEGCLHARVGMGSFVRAPRVRPAPAVRHCQYVAPQSRHSARARAILERGAVHGPPDPGVRHSFQHGMTRPGAWLRAEWARLVARVAPRVAASGCGTQGLPALREAVASHLRIARGVHCTADDILVVNGARQAVALAIRVLLDPGDPVAVEDPGHPALRHVLQLEGMDVSGVPVDDQGMRVELLAGHPAKLVCASPAQQFPTGAVLSRARREALLDHARRQDAWILERQCDARFRRGECPLEPLHSMDRWGRVVHYGSFSQALFPALRLGFLVMPRGLRDDFIAAKWAADGAQPELEQHVLARYIAEGGYARHLQRTAKLLAERRQRLRQALAHPRFSDLRVGGGGNAGMHLVAWLDRTDPAGSQRLVALARQRGLALDPLEHFHLRQPAPAGLLLGFGGLPAPDIPAATAILGDCLEAVAAELRPRTAPSSSSGRWLRPGGCARPTLRTRRRAPGG